MKSGEKVGTAVSVVSTGIIVFVAAGGEFLGEANIIIGTVAFDKPGIVKLAVFILYLYWIYRLCVLTWNPWKNYKNLVVKELRSDNKLWRYVKEVIIKNLRSDLYNKKLQNPDLEKVYGKVENTRDISISWTRDSTNAITIKEKQVRVGLQFKRISNGEIIWNHPIELDRIFFWQRFIFVSLKRDHIFTMIVPWLLAFLAMPFAIIEFYNHLN